MYYDIYSIILINISSTILPAIPAATAGRSSSFDNGSQIK
jgi:hypothetical protein